MSRLDRLERNLNLRVHVEADFRHQVVQALVAELPLHLREDGLDGVELGAGSHVIDGPNVQLGHQLSDLLVLVHPELVHEQRERFFPSLTAQLHEMGAELWRFDRLRINVDDADAFLRRHGCEGRPVAHVEFLLVRGQVRVPRGPFAQLDRPLREEDLVCKDQSAAFAFGLLHLPQHALAVLHEVPTHPLRHSLFQPNLLTSDAAFQVKASQGRDCDALVGEPPMKEDGPLLHRQPGPLLERVQARQKLHVLRAEFAQELVGTRCFVRLERVPTEMLHLVVSHAKPSCDRAVGGILVRTRGGLRAPESEQQHRLAHLCLLLLRQLRHPFHHVNKLYDLA